MTKLPTEQQADITPVDETIWGGAPAPVDKDQNKAREPRRWTPSAALPDRQTQPRRTLFRR